LWKGEELKCYPLADPYIFPEAIDGWYYLVINSQVVGASEGKRGCQLMLKSKDLIQWESHGIAAYPECFERMETAQIWEHNGRWYMLFGGVPDMGTYIYTASTFCGPYEPQEWSKLELPAGIEYYLGKVEKDTNGNSVFLANDCLFEEKRLLGTYELSYFSNGKVSIL
jgi:beta-fructofuranosidase